jgi:hypothetical protein
MLHCTIWVQRMSEQWLGSRPSENVDQTGQRAISTDFRYMLERLLSIEADIAALGPERRDARLGAEGDRTCLGAKFRM